MSHSTYFIGADIGGTHCSAALVDLPGKKIISASFVRKAIDASAEAGEIIAAWAACIASAKKNTDTGAVCLAMPGPFDYEQGISWMQGQHKYEKLYGLNIKELLAQELQMPAANIFTDNDAACFLHGEVFAGAAAKHAAETVIGITLGTGLGSAIYNQGAAKNADLWCMPFREGIAENYISSGWFVQRFHELTGIVVSGVQELAQLAPANEKARLVFLEFGNNLAQFLLQFIALERPAAICIGGNISKAFDLFGSAVRDAVGRQHPHITIQPSVLGEEAVLLGAVGSWFSKHEKKFLHLR